MATVKRGLGKGIDGLIPNKSAEEKKASERTTTRKKSLDGASAAKKEEVKGGVLKVKISLVQPNTNQPRKNFEEDSLNDLSDSIKEFGIISPLLVKEKNGMYEIIAGERRWRAAKEAGLKEVPVIVNNDYDEQQTLEVSIIENIQRERLNPIEEANGYKRLSEEFHLKQDEIAERVSKSRTEITNKMRLLKLDERVQKMLIDEMISTGHARALLAFEDGDAQYEAATRVFDEKLSVRDIEKMVRAATREKAERKRVVDEQYALACQEAAQRMSNSIGTKVNINQKSKGGKGKIEIEFYSQEDLERIINLITS